MQWDDMDDGTDSDWRSQGTCARLVIYTGVWTSPFCWNSELWGERR